MNTENKPSNPRAYPRNSFNSNGDITAWGEEFEGMTLRDYFANSAMQGMIANKTIYNGEIEGNCSEENFTFIAKDAYLIADAMLKQRGL